MNRTFAGVAALFLMMAPTSAFAQAAPRAVVDHVAQAIGDHYFDPARGASIAADLRARAQSGAYDRFTDPRDLASAISAQLHPYDGHFVVEWADPATNPAQPPGPQGSAASDAQVARGNYGFQGVEMFPGGVGYLDLRAFADFDPGDPASAARRAADAAMTMLAGASAIIIDERDNGGGSPAMVGYLASYFEPADADIYNTFHSRQGEMSERSPIPVSGQRRLDTPLFIVTSGRTGSAAESFAYTLQAAHRATIVGEASGGGANPGGLLDVGDGFRVFISFATPINPITHSNWEGAGVQPDVRVSTADALMHARMLALQAILAAHPTADAALEAQWALDVLQANGPHLNNSQLRAYAGIYGLRSVTVENGQLVLHRDRRPGLVLQPLSSDLFAVEGAAPLQRVRFERDAHGAVRAMTLSLVNGPEFHDLRQSR